MNRWSFQPNGRRPSKESVLNELCSEIWNNETMDHLGWPTQRLRDDLVKLRVETLLVLLDNVTERGQP